MVHVIPWTTTFTTADQDLALLTISLVDFLANSPPVCGVVAVGISLDAFDSSNSCAGV